MATQTKVTGQTAKKPSVKRATKAVTKKLDKVLTGQVKIYAGTAKAKSGAQRIAPDHSPRAKVANLVAPAQVLKAAKHLSGPSTGLDRLRAVEQFLFLQSELLDGKHWQSYIELFSDDGVYWMPAAPEQTDWEGSPSIFAEDKLMMQVRLGRVTHPNAWSQAPLWATNHMIGNIQIESETSQEVVVRSRFHMMELRRDNVRHFGGTYRHTLVKSQSGYKIKLQRVDLFNGQAPFDYVLQVWV
jgi:3-phenylpropionate/cinnamic acid dioxygenase small subunit